MSAPTPATRLYLMTPPLSAEEAEGFAPRLSAALAAGDIASVLLRARGPGSRAYLRPLSEMTAGRGAAALLQNPAPADFPIDGVHAAGGDVAKAVAAARGRFIVGAGGLRSRHDAMLAAEEGADYVMFGEPGADGGGPPLETVRERVRWWAEIFEVSCVAYASRLADVRWLADEGADFVALGAAVFDAADPAAAVNEAMRGIRNS